MSDSIKNRFKKNIYIWALKEKDSMKKKNSLQISYITMLFILDVFGKATIIVPKS